MNSNARPPISDLRQQQEARERALAELVSSGAVVSTDAPPAVLEGLRRLQQAHEARVAALVSVVEQRHAAAATQAEEQFHAGLINVLEYRSLVRASEAQAERAKQEARRTPGPQIAWQAAAEAAHAAAEAAVVKVWAEVARQAQGEAERAGTTTPPAQRR